MKSSKFLLTLLMAGLFLISASTTALAAVEAWATDPATGCKIGIVFFTDGFTLVSAKWSGPMVSGLAEGQGNLQLVYKEKSGKETKGQGDVEMKAGKMDGHVSFTWSDGESYDGNYKEGQRSGSGVFKFSDGRVYDGEWKAGKRDGYGVSKDAAGKVLHDGQWKNGRAMVPLKADKVLGIPWGATDSQVKSILTQRPNTKAYSFMNGKDGNDRWHGYSGPFADFSDAEIFVRFYQDKMWMVQITWPLKEDQVLDRFNAVKQGLTQRYGAPVIEQGKYLDSIVVWDLGGTDRTDRGYAVNLQIRKNTIQYIAGVDPAKTHPFRVFIAYFDVTASDKMTAGAGSSGNPGGGSKDY